MRCFPARHTNSWLLVAATVVLVSALLMCFADLEATPQMPHQEQYCCLVEPLNQPSTALLAQSVAPERLPEPPMLALILPMKPSLHAGWVLRHCWRRVVSIRPIRRYYRAGLAHRAPPHMPRSFSCFNV